MATRSGIDTDVLNRLDDDHVFIGSAVDLDFDSGNSLKSIVTIIVMGNHQWFTSFCF